MTTHEEIKTELNNAKEYKEWKKEWGERLNKLKRGIENEEYEGEKEELENEKKKLEINGKCCIKKCYVRERFVRAHGDFQLWEIEENTDIEPLIGVDDDVFSNHRDPPAQGSNEVNVTQPFYGGGRVRDNVFPEIIIGRSDFYRELTENPPDLSKGIPCSESISNKRFQWMFNGWKALKDSLIIAGIIERYHKNLSMRASGEKNESPNNDETYMYRNKSSISTESLLASFIKDGIYIRLHSENHIHIQITSHLENGRECIGTST
ncbi:12047_t:CDS:2 [Funneliformis mosseae]|uniref:12047_t:CDS:1 n=1 Tax=Funneliformis mosseae TaxID=27381 RepID=A0A9N8ZI63_FUNMO|nr:12047_t:CDS:2 [Funneliformis mosseae]